MDTYNADNTNDRVTNDFQLREQLITTLKNRFTTYGYKQIRTPTFEPYELYTTVNGTIAPDEMIKVIDSTGKVLVLRPDVTIPITQKLAREFPNTLGERRYFYVLDVFRQSFDQLSNKEQTQAGVEYFGEHSPEVDAEVIALAIHTLKDIGLVNFTIEIGDAGFFKELVTQMDLPEKELEQFKQLIQAKNINEIKIFLDELSVDTNLGNVIQEIPFLYGHPFDVLKRAMDLTKNEQITKKLQNLITVYEILQAYGVGQNVVIDLGLINHMDYYSDIIFQGFTENVGKPILMGGRYDQLANQFNAGIPAIGFACDIDLLLDSTKEQHKPPRAPIDVTIYYEKEKQKKGLSIANELRQQGYRVLTYTINTDQSPHSLYTIRLEKDKNTFLHKNQTQLFTDQFELLQLLQEVEEEA